MWFQPHLSGGSYFPGCAPAPSWLNPSCRSYCSREDPSSFPLPKKQNKHRLLKSSLQESLVYTIVSFRSCRWNFSAAPTYSYLSKMDSPQILCYFSGVSEITLTSPSATPAAVTKFTSILVVLELMRAPEETIIIFYRFSTPLLSQPQLLPRWKGYSEEQNNSSNNTLFLYVFVCVNVVFLSICTARPQPLWSTLSILLASATFFLFWTFVTLLVLLMFWNSLSSWISCF